ncbi:MAG: glycosyltransferase [Eubacterium sp.]|nr:glycosyltransferase [Eubacterium sp.]
MNRETDIDLNIDKDTTDMQRLIFLKCWDVDNIMKNRQHSDSAWKFYFNQGEGYSEDNLLRIKPKRFKDDSILLENVSLPENLITVRVDPIEGHECILRILKIETEKGEPEWKSLNGWNYKDALIFNTDDPQIEIILPEGTKMLRIHADIWVMDYLHMEEESYWDLLEIPAFSAYKERLGKLIASEETFREHSDWYRKKYETASIELLETKTKLDSAESCILELSEEIQSNTSKSSNKFRKLLSSVKHEGVKNTLKKIKNRHDDVMTAEQENIPKTGAFSSISLLSSSIEESGGSIYNAAGLDDSKNDIVLLVSHSLNLTGAPVAVKSFAESLLRLGKKPVIVSPDDGDIRSYLTEEGISVWVYPDIYKNSLIAQNAGLFRLILVCTIVGGPLIETLNGVETPVIWWIHEASVSYQEEFISHMPQTLRPNITVCCGGQYAEKQLKQRRPEYNTYQLLYSVPDKSGEYTGEFSALERKADKTVFAIVGTQEKRKGQDVLVKAIRMLTEENRKKAVFVFVGKEDYKPIHEDVFHLNEDFPLNTLVIDQLTPDELDKLYKRMNCLICASTDDPMPIVVTDAMANSKLVICSENTGSADLISMNKAGLIYRNNDPVELAACISEVIKGIHDKEEICRRARITFEEYFTTAVFDRKVAMFFSGDETAGICDLESDEVKNAVISVIIPTYNPGKEIEKTIKNLRLQTGIGKTELIIVDSGTTNGTLESLDSLADLCIKIPNEDFSHSFARNLGASKASGDILVFMTQDAYPSSEYWLRDMAAQILQHKADAVSVREECPEETDLFYKVLSCAHTLWLGISKKDRIGRKNDFTDVYEKRKNASLNDVACAIKHSIHEEFPFRGRYAEDLDLGLRLTDNGYTVRLMHQPTVIHGHNRPAFYYLKRAFVETAALNEMLGIEKKIVDTEDLTADILGGYFRMIKSLALIKKKNIHNVEQFTREFASAWTKASEKDLSTTEIPAWKGEKETEQLTALLLNHAPSSLPKDTAVGNQLYGYCMNTLPACINHLGAVVSDPVNEFSKCLYKQMMLIIGASLANVSEEDVLYRELQPLTVGV